MIGKIDLVLTKSVSRFARNTVDALQNIRKLKEKSIPIIFEKENVNTMESGGELLITILSSQAQEESRNISENTRWGLTRNFENGKISVNHKKFMGYTKDEDGNLIIVPEQAKIVRRIFKEYLEGKSSIQIARSLESDNIKTVTGLDHWNPRTIDNMLIQEKYSGDVCMQKTLTLDFLTKKKVKNDGYVPKYFIEDNHEGIIPKDLYNEVQAEKLRRANLNKSAVTRKKNTAEKEKSKYSSKYVLTDLMVCGSCGHAYRRQVWSKYGVKTAVWRCEDRLKQGTKSKCTHSPTLNENELHRAIMTAINKVVENTDGFISTFRENVIQVMNNHTSKIATTEYDEQIAHLQNQMLKLIEDNAKNGIVSEDFDNNYKVIAQQIAEVQTNRQHHTKAQEQLKHCNKGFAQLDNAIATVSPQVREFDQDLVKRLIQSVKVGRNSKLEIQFYSGIVVEQMVDGD